MTDAAPLQRALLELGLEDLIPVWEAVTSPEVVATADPSRNQADIAEALAQLGEARLVSFYLGRWHGDPGRVPVADALALLSDPRWFSSDTEPDDMRLYYVNIENLPDG
jgi:hypothetical protein